MTNAEARFNKSHIRKVYACFNCLAVTCHLHFWQNDRDFLRATVVTRGWNGYRNKILRVGRTTHFFCFFTGKQNVSETMPFGENSHSAKFQADISNSF